MSLCEGPEARNHPADCQVCETRNAIAEMFAQDARAQAALEKQLAEDTCSMHGVLCCFFCFDMRPAA